MNTDNFYRMVKYTLTIVMLDAIQSNQNNVCILRTRHYVKLTAKITNENFSKYFFI